ncbi:unnamed protein product [Parnassius mnemosyne]|uniref:BED-type domain-containing protein n=1 Tax=Parnassius mnemosyne TaxID=213953 RepID=A0AAV1KXB0_9NEOP
MAPNKRSVVWQFFDKNKDNNKVKCKLCSSVYKDVGNTTTLVKHIRKRHLVQYSEAIGQNLPRELNENVPEQICTNSLISGAEAGQIQNDIILPPSQIRNVTESNEPPPKRPKQMRLIAPTKINQKVGDDALLDLIVLDMQPLQIVENEGFKKYSLRLNPDYELPSRKKLTQMLEDKYKICRSEVIGKLQSVEHIALTTDIWSSDSQKSFICVTAHFINNSKLHSMVVSTTELSQHHTALNIANALRTTLTEWEIYDKVVTIVTDNASSMKKAVKDYLQKRNHFCVAHTLNLAVKDCISKDSESETDHNRHLKNAAVLDIVSKSRAIVTHFKQSIKSSNTLRDMQSQMNLEIIKLKQDVQTRWNSTFYMFERLLKVKAPLSATLSLIDSPPPNLNSTEWQILEDCVALLQPVEKISTVLSGESYPTQSIIIPLVRGLQSAIIKKRPSTEPGNHLQRSLLEIIDKRLGVYESNRTAAKATILDPRFKKNAFGTISTAENAVKYVLEELVQYQPVQGQTSERAIASTSEVSISNKADDSDIWEDFDRKISETVMHQTPISSASIVLRE